MQTVGGKVAGSFIPYRLHDETEAAKILRAPEGEMFLVGVAIGLTLLLLAVGAAEDGEQGAALGHKRQTSEEILAAQVFRTVPVKNHVKAARVEEVEFQEIAAGNAVMVGGRGMREKIVDIGLEHLKDMPVDTIGTADVDPPAVANVLVVVVADVEEAFDRSMSCRLLEQFDHGQFSPGIAAPGFLYLAPVVQSQGNLHATILLKGVRVIRHSLPQASKKERLPTKAHTIQRVKATFSGRLAQLLFAVNKSRCRPKLTQIFSCK